MKEEECLVCRPVAGRDRDQRRSSSSNNGSSSGCLHHGLPDLLAGGSSLALTILHGLHGHLLGRHLVVGLVAHGGVNQSIQLLLQLFNLDSSFSGHGAVVNHVDISDLFANVVIQVSRDHDMPGILATVDGVDLCSTESRTSGTFAVLQTLVVLGHVVDLLAAGRKLL